MDFNNAPEQRVGDLIPDGTVATVQMNVRQGGHGDGGWLKRSKAGNSLGLDCEFTVVEGPHAKRKFWTLFTVSGETSGQQTAAEISGSLLRAVLESARGIRPDDMSEGARQGRRVSGYGDFDGVRFIARIGVEKGTDGYKDKNKLAEVITPDKKAWSKVEQSPGARPVGQVAAAVVANAAAQGAPQRPSWAS